MTVAHSRVTGLRKRVRRNLEDYGFAATGKKIAAALAGPIYRRRFYRIYRIKLSAGALAPPRVDPGLALRLLAADDGDAIRQVETLAEWLEGTVADGLRGGDLCVAVFSEDTLAGFNLVTFGEAYVPGVAYRLRFRPDEAWSVHIAVNPEFRRRGIASALRRQAFQELQARGIRRFYGGAFPSNVASLELARSIGFRELADIEYRRILLARRWRVHRMNADG
jgi:L-amino acid N-acyltransferase YncA